ncbi:MAG: carboxypeptidase-like regulatory domain-containing protein [Chloroflexi bacterium]|nr:carboxypeptidase-like regulatory domain-containing protein [Chloroflexota bacterium]MBU1750318.1 carboxypeptidase-like regulatory domain-containing protein [Chloroflexota bacterium]MBU1877935.1 carboxypeptidase-like regulatory domain-containing protein [Chloroflexota bacterium]
MSGKTARIGLLTMLILSMVLVPGATGQDVPTLRNGSFSEPYITWHIDGRAEYVAEHWTPFVDGYDPVVPEFRPNYEECRDGFPSQWVWSTYSSYQCGLYQTVGGLTPGDAYTYQLWILSSYGVINTPPDDRENIGKQLAVDLWGGDDWLDPGLFRGAEDFRDRRAYFAYLSFTAETPTTTLFIHINNRWPSNDCQALWDEARLYPSPVTTTNTSRVVPLPATTTADAFPVFWELLIPDAASATGPVPPASPPVAYSYDVQYQTNGGNWTTWLTNTLATSATFGAGSPVNLEPGDTYAFRCRAHDATGGTNEGRVWGWVEQYPATPDAQITVAAWSVVGHVVNNRSADNGDGRSHGVPGALVTLTGSLVATATTGAAGDFWCAVPATGTYTLVVTPALGAASYAPLPPMTNVDVQRHVTGLELLLPPADDVVHNGDFTGADPLAGWSVGGDTPPTVTTPAHTGPWAVQLGRAAGRSILSQTVVLTDALISPTLSFAYAFSPTVPSDTFRAWVAGASAVTVTKVSTATPWAYVTADLPITGTVTLYFQVDDDARASSAGAVAWLDEVHLGSQAPPLARLYLPLVLKQP